jgi:hypothetical protein
VSPLGWKEALLAALEVEDEPSAGSQAAEYVRRLYENILSWYKDVHTRVQILLGIDTIFLSFLLGTAIANRTDVKSVTSAFGVETWILLGLMASCFVASVALVIRCLNPGFASNELVRAEIDRLGGNGNPPLPAAVMWYFHHIAALDAERFVATATRADVRFESEALARQIKILAGRLVKKFRYAQRAFLATALGLVIFVATATDYLLRVTFASSA